MRHFRFDLILLLPICAIVCPASKICIVGRDLQCEHFEKKLMGSFVESGAAVNDTVSRTTVHKDNALTELNVILASVQRAMV